MKYRARNAQRDTNEPEIVAALESIGATVIRLHQPVDLLVGFAGTNYLAEVKLPLGPKGGSSHSELNASQKRFFLDWPGQVQIWRSPEDALRTLGFHVKTREST